MCVCVCVCVCVPGVHDLDQLLNEQYLKVTIGHDEALEADCHIHTLPNAGSWVCTSTGLDWGTLGGRCGGAVVCVCDCLQDDSHCRARLNHISNSRTLAPTHPPTHTPTPTCTHRSRPGGTVCQYGWNRAW